MLRRTKTQRPLRRRPKELDSAPSLFQAGGEGGNLVLAGARGSDGPLLGVHRGSTASGTPDEPAELVTADAERVDAETLRRAQEITSRLALTDPDRQIRPRRGLGELHTVPYRGTSADVDLDRTLEALVENPVPEQEDIAVRERLRTRRAVALLVDVSGSMRGERVRTAAAAVGALVSQLVRDDLAVVAFWSDAALLLPMGEHVPPSVLLETLVRIPVRGLTNVAFPLEVAAQQLAATTSADARAVLLSDCVHNAGPDPRSLAAALPRLDVLLDTSGEHDGDLARDLARLGRGRLETARHHRDVAPALTRIFAA